MAGGPPQYDAVVVGAGLAGCASATALARRGHRILLLEAARYPVHKLCGEFLSPESGRSLRELGVHAAVRSRGAVDIRRVIVTSASGAPWHGELPEAALGISRWALDPILYDAAVGAGAEGLQGARVRRVTGDGRGGFTVQFEEGGRARAVQARLVLGAYGKRSRIDRTLRRDFVRRRHDFVAFKAHYRGADLAQSIELHAFDGGYCGMSPVEAGVVNVCLIAWTGALKDAGATFEALRERTMRANPALAARLDSLEPASDRLISISQIPFCFKELFAGDVMMVGDTAGLIAPLCGDGMAMAFRSAELAAPAAAAFLEGRLRFGEMRRRYESAWRREFVPRMRIGLALQRLLFRPRVSRLGIAALNGAPWLGRALIRATRG